MIAKAPPPEVEPVLAWIRDKVPRPQTLPTCVDGQLLGWPSGGVLRCILGLVPSALTETPVSGDDFHPYPPVTAQAIKMTWQWWDRFTVEERVAAVNFVWPPKVDDDS